MAQQYNSLKKLRWQLASQTSPRKGFQPEHYVITTEQTPVSQTGNEPAPFVSCSNSCPTDIKKSKEHTKATLTGNTTNPLLTINFLLIEERLVRDEQTNELYLPLTSTVVLKRKQEMLYVHLDFENNLTVDALVDSSRHMSLRRCNCLEWFGHNKRESPE